MNNSKSIKNSAQKLGIVENTLGLAMETPHFNLSGSMNHHYIQHELAQHPVSSRVICGAIAGVIAKTAIAPAEKVKMSFQTSTQKFSFLQAFNKGKEMFLKDGILSLWKGHSTTIVRVAPFAGLNFLFHDYAELAMKKSLKKEQLPFVYKFLAGSFGGACATILTYPLDVLRVRLALIKNSTWSSTFKQGGLYQGLFPTLLGIVPYSGTIWCVKQTLHEYYPTVSGHNLTNFESFFLNGFAGICGQFVSYPLDVLRRRMQMFVPAPGQPSPSLRQMFIHLVETEGYPSLFKGFSMNLFKGPVALSISLSTYDGLRDWISDGEKQYKRACRNRIN
eukprot:gene11051-23107_t